MGGCIDIDGWMGGWMTHQQSFNYLGTGLPGLMCLAQGYNAVSLVRLERTGSPSVSYGWIDTWIDRWMDMEIDG